MTAPEKAQPGAVSDSGIRHRLLAAITLIVLAIGGLTLFERLRERPQAPPAPHEPAEALIVPPTPPGAAATPEAPVSPAEGPPPPPVVVNEADVPVRPSPPPRARATGAPAAAAASYVVQAGVFTSAANARSLQKRLAQAGIRAKVETRVQLGPYGDRHEAEQALEKLKALGIDAVLVVPR